MSAAKSLEETVAGYMAPFIAEVNAVADYGRSCELVGRIRLQARRMETLRRDMRVFASRETSTRGDLDLLNQITFSAVWLEALLVDAKRRRDIIYADAAAH